MYTITQSSLDSLFVVAASLSDTRHKKALADVIADALTSPDDVKATRKHKKKASKRKHRTLLSKEQRASLRKDYAEGKFTVTELATEYDVGQATVSRILSHGREKLEISRAKSLA